MADITITHGGITVNLHAEKIIQNFKKNLYKTEKGQSSSTATPVTYIRDRRKVTEDIVIQGFIEDTAVANAFTTKANLKTIFLKKGNIDTFIWRGVTYSSEYAMERLQFEDSPIASGYSTSTPDVARIRYTIGLVWGTEK